MTTVFVGHLSQATWRTSDQIIRQVHEEWLVADRRTRT